MKAKQPRYQPVTANGGNNRDYDDGYDEFDINGSSSDEDSKIQLPVIPSPRKVELPPARNALARYHQDFCLQCGGTDGFLGECTTCSGLTPFFFSAGFDP